MEAFSSSMDLVQFIGKLGDLKEEHYQLLLLQSAMIEVLIDKGVFTRKEIEGKAAQMDKLRIGSPYPMA